MSKARSVFVCQNCGTESAKWVGQCPSCREWNTYVEETVQKNTPRRGPDFLVKNTAKPERLTEIQATDSARIHTGIEELNRITGGGIVPGSIVLLGGEPGIGKSTLALQVALSIRQKNILYVSAEESTYQIKLRANRLKKERSDCYFLNETSLENVFSHIESLKPGFLIIDSIQTIYTNKLDSAPGSISQVRECTTDLLRFAKESSVPVLLIGHITKDGSLAGPKALEHIVDTVLLFEGDHYLYRVLRTTKNRFGSTSDIGIFEMMSDGLKEVNNPSELMLSMFEEDLSGKAIASTIDGNRSFLIECQALVSSSVFASPQRSSTGIDIRRLNMLLAVLEKKAKFHLVSKDVFFNAAGGIKITDPSADLAIVAAILSSGTDIPVSKKICFAGEIGLSGEVRPVNRLDQRIKEAEKTGFEKMVISKYNIKGMNPAKSSLELIPLEKIENLAKKIF